MQKSTWTRDPVAKAWYFHRFYDFQPDLNTANPEVQAEILKIMGFWLQLGVSGFRMDAVPFVIAEEGRRCSTKPVEQYDMLRELPRVPAMARRATRSSSPRPTCCRKDDLDYFGDGRRPHAHDVQFPGQPDAVLRAGRRRQRARSPRRSTATKPRPATAQWGSFLRNHDELDLGRLTRRRSARRVFAAFGPDKDMQLYDRGIRRRLAPMLQGDRRRLELAYSLMLTLPGTPVIRYGDEIGMGDDLTLPERNCARTPMQWSTEPHGGFTSSDEAGRAR